MHSPARNAKRVLLVFFFFHYYFFFFFIAYRLTFPRSATRGQYQRRGLAFRSDIMETRARRISIQFGMGHSSLLCHNNNNNNNNCSDALSPEYKKIECLLQRPLLLLLLLLLLQRIVHGQIALNRASRAGTIIALRVGIMRTIYYRDIADIIIIIV